MIGRACFRLCVLGFGVALFLACNTDDDTPAGPCANGVRDQDEVGVDCGGTCGVLCDGAECTTDANCKSGKCENGSCAASAGKTCGVGLPNPCDDNNPCGVDQDCRTDYCDVTCKPPPSNVHTDGRRNGGEADVDCGGTVKDKPCAAGQRCIGDDDCEGKCTNKKCDAPSITDGKKNGDETDVDCGGATAPKCVLDKACKKNDDCELDACTNDKCVTPTATDGVKNGKETDVDCGGPGVTGYVAPRCTVEKACADKGDCKTGACSPLKKCAVASCATAETAGITTCGAKEVGDPAAVHDSCCKSLPMPTRTMRRLDKYEITAGRFRTFLTTAGPNIRAWLQAYAAANANSQIAKLFTQFPVVKDIFPAADRFDNVNLTAHMGLDIDNYDGNRGCYNGTGSYSGNTYWMDDTHQADFGLPTRTLPRTTSDAKPLNCAQPLMFAAFCAWDGGELATAADYLDVWPTAQTFPWGNTNLCTEGGGLGVPGNYKPCNAFNWCNGGFRNGGFECQNLSLNIPGGSAPGIFYQFPLGTDLGNDTSPLIGAPGRFQQDVTMAKGEGEGWFDLFGNLGEYTGDFTAPGASPVLSTFCDMSAAPMAGKPTCTRAQRPGQTGTLYSGVPQVGMVGSSWEGHQYTKTNWPASGLPSTFQYGKFGARCVRPAASY